MIRAALALVLFGCHGPVEDTGPDEQPVTYPTLVAEPAHRGLIVDRVAEEPHASLLARVEERAARDWQEPADPAVWDHRSNGHNAETAQANALLAWLYDDADAAAKAVDFLHRLETDYDTHDTWDINIRMPHTLIGYAAAIDLLRGTDYLSADDAALARDKLTAINAAFFDEFVASDGIREAVLGTTQNNHPIRTAAAIGYVALAFPDAPGSAEHLDWAVSELDYLWAERGQYVQPDGGVSEGPFYYGFGLGPTLAFTIALHHAAPDRVFHRDCRNRADVDPWAGHGCVDGEAFTFDNPLVNGTLEQTVQWWIALRLPSGLCPPLEDAYFNPLNGGALLTSFGGGPELPWAWEHVEERPFEATHGLDLLPWHLAYVDPAVEPAPPSWTTRVLPEAGQAVLRSGWGSDALWTLVTAEHGSVRKTVHDHVDGTSFSLAAYGEYLLVDPGYYKASDLSLPETAQSVAHNVVLVDGRGAPSKGLLTDFGDTDAFLRHAHDGERVDYVEAHQAYRDASFERSVAMLRERYVVVADRIASDAAEERTFAWRLGGNAGLEAGGTFTVHDDGATWERAGAGVDVRLASTAGPPGIVEPLYRELEPPHVHRYGLDRATAHHGVIDGRVDAVEPGFLAVLAPWRAGATGADGPLEVTALDLGAGVAAWTVASEGALDLVLLRDPGAPTDLVLPDDTAVHTDGRLAIVELSGPPLALLARGTTLTVDGVVRATADGSDRVVDETAPARSWSALD